MAKTCDADDGRSPCRLTGRASLRQTHASSSTSVKTNDDVFIDPPRIEGSWMINVGWEVFLEVERLSTFETVIHSCNSQRIDTLFLKDFAGNI
jgi:hypothetical protein